MDIVIVAQYLRNIEDFSTNNSRFLYLAKMLDKNGENQIEIITSDFNHGLKRHFNKSGKLENIKITPLHEPGYPKNVCIKRFLSHNRLADNIKKYLNSRKKPDVVYSAVPSLAVAWAAADYCKKNNVRFIIDIQDLWPEGFKMVFNVPVLSSLIFGPMTRQANRLYASADEIVAVSDTYAQRAVMHGSSKKATVAFLGTRLRDFDSYRGEAAKLSDNAPTLVYIGSLSNSYDLISVFDAMDIIKKRNNLPQLKMLVIGNGARKAEFERHAESLKLNVEFTGTLPYPEMVKRLCRCDIALNPIKSGSAGSIINKVGDYAMAGLPVINTQESQEYRDLLQKYGAGITCENGDVTALTDAIETLCKDASVRQRMGSGNRKMGAELFDREKSYQKIKNIILNNEE